jgi:hypothetical protein
MSNGRMGLARFEPVPSHDPRRASTDLPPKSPRMVDRRLVRALLMYFVF